MLTNITNRGWDSPGGHIEPGETPEQAIIRELYEEAGAQTKHSVLIGYLKLTNEVQSEQKITNTQK